MQPEFGCTTYAHAKAVRRVAGGGLGAFVACRRTTLGGGKERWRADFRGVRR
ncbi:hypothetical protein OG394_13525 [Kribbella sp. NBC_01245]|uniref:hypothetical protein n=1 Tax=Kribbella sp. NBC_01245 TaxID=2903578 RepID=UPI002E2AEB23|nr:hypothetical protein [Kribbella sp. NBC_01245]